MARDVRFLAAILEIITELERIGDYAKGICKINLLLSVETIDPIVLNDLATNGEARIRYAPTLLGCFCYW